MRRLLGTMLLAVVTAAVTPAAPPDSVPNGPWQAQVTLVSGLTTDTATASVQFAALASHPGLSLTVWFSLALVALAAIVAVMAFVLAQHAARRRRVPA